MSSKPLDIMFITWIKKGQPVHVVNILVSTGVPVDFNILLQITNNA